MQSRVEMERIEELEELKELNERQATVDFEGMLNKKQLQQKETEQERILRENREVEHELEQFLMEKGIENRDGVLYKRVRDIDSDEEEERLKKIPKEDPMKSTKSIRQAEINKLRGLVRVKKVINNNNNKAESSAGTASTDQMTVARQSSSGGGGLSLLAAYNDSDGNSDND